MTTILSAIQRPLIRMSAEKTQVLLHRLSLNSIVPLKYGNIHRQSEGANNRASRPAVHAKVASLLLGQVFSRICALLHQTSSLNRKTQHLDLASQPSGQICSH